MWILASFKIIYKRNQKYLIFHDQKMIWQVCIVHCLVCFLRVLLSLLKRNFQSRYLLKVISCFCLIFQKTQEKVTSNGPQKYIAHRSGKKREYLFLYEVYFEKHVFSKNKNFRNKLLAFAEQHNFTFVQFGKSKFDF